MGFKHTALVELGHVGDMKLAGLHERGCEYMYRGFYRTEKHAKTYLGLKFLGVNLDFLGKLFVVLVTVKHE